MFTFFLIRIDWAHMEETALSQSLYNYRYCFKTIYILKAKSNFTLLLYINLFWVLVSGILNVFNSY